MHGALFAACGAALIAIVNWRSQRALPTLMVRGVSGGPDVAGTLPDLNTEGTLDLHFEPALESGEVASLPTPSAGGTNSWMFHQSWADAASAEYLRWSIVALVVMVVVSAVIGWWVAGRMLAPLGTMTARAQAMNASDLSARFDTSGPADEMADLARTFNAMLARIQAAFSSERQLIANMSHELRTPLATQRAVLELALPDGADDAGPHPGELAVASRVALEQNQRAAAIIDAMLVLAKAGRAEERVDERIDLARVVARVVGEHLPDAEAAGVEMTCDVDVGDAEGTDEVEAVVGGEATLMERLVANLVRNAIVHNVSEGTAAVRLEMAGEGGVRLTVTNTGPEIPQAVASDLVKPFRRSTAARTGSHKGQGLGLAIVQAVADYHAATLTIRPRDGGGLHVEVVFPAPDSAILGAAQPCAYQPDGGSRSNPGTDPQR
jgi:signal transduction histidine kinase